MTIETDPSKVSPNIAKRVTACINFCRNIPTEELEGFEMTHHTQASPTLSFDEVSRLDKSGGYIATVVPTQERRSANGEVSESETDAQGR